MPTKKTRVGFIPRNDVLQIISKLSYENNLSYSKIINILVEEALHKRGLFNISKNANVDKINTNNRKIIYEKNLNFIEKSNNNFKNKFIKENNNFNEVKDGPLDAEIYEKFLMFLQFQERMKKSDF